MFCLLAKENCHTKTKSIGASLNTHPMYFVIISSSSRHVISCKEKYIKMTLWRHFLEYLAHQLNYLTCALVMSR